MNFILLSAYVDCCNNCGNMQGMSTIKILAKFTQPSAGFSLSNLLSTSLLSKNLKIKVDRNIILPVVLYGCGTWLLTFREERRLRVFENMVLRRIFGPGRDKVTAERRKLHHEELTYRYSSNNIVGVIK